MTPEEYYHRLEEEMVLARARARAARAASELPPAYSLLPPASSLLTAPPVAGGPGYAVYVGCQPGVYATWEYCIRETKGVSHNSYKAFSSLAAAERAFSAAVQRGLVSTAEVRAADIRRVVERQRLDPSDLPLCLAFIDDPTSKAMAEGSSRFYVVYVGLQPGVYLTFHECSFLTSGYKGSKHSSFVTEDEAVEALKAALAEGTVYKYMLQ